MRIGWLAISKLPTNCVDRQTFAPIFAVDKSKPWMHIMAAMSELQDVRAALQAELTQAKANVARLEMELRAVEVAIEVSSRFAGVRPEAVRAELAPLLTPEPPAPESLINICRALLTEQWHPTSYFVPMVQHARPETGLPAIHTAFRRLANDPQVEVRGTGGRIDPYEYRRRQS
jgi:hypothetical protein